jgi:HNH endonuclease
MNDVSQAMVTFEGGRASHCQLAAYHAPEPLRYVFHHIQPQEAGGVTAEENLAQVCDGCHIAVHVLLYALARGGGSLPAGVRVNRRQLALARQGYEACAAAGTVNRIPDEGGALVFAGPAGASAQYGRKR